MNQHFFVNPWAVAGDLQSGGIPEGAQGDGSVSYDQGFTSDYALNLTGGSPAKAIQRVTFNSLMNDVTGAVQNLQEWGTPEWIDATDNGGTSFGYGQGAMCRYGGNAYISTVGSNTDTPGTSSKWLLFARLETQAGQVTTSGGGFLVTFPIAFDVAPAFVSANCMLASTGSLFATVINQTSISATGFSGQVWQWNFTAQQWALVTLPYEVIWSAKRSATGYFT